LSELLESFQFSKTVSISVVVKICSTIRPRDVELVVVEDVFELVGAADVVRGDSPGLWNAATPTQWPWKKALSFGSTRNVPALTKERVKELAIRASFDMADRVLEITPEVKEHGEGEGVEVVLI